MQGENSEMNMGRGLFFRKLEQDLHVCSYVLVLLLVLKEPFHTVVEV